jgi:hypothetical protein
MEAVGGSDIRELVRLFLVLAGLAIILSALLLAWIFWRVRRIRLPADADFFTALRYTPFAVVILLDLLDFGLDFLSAPIAWAILGRLGLKPLRGVTVVEELVPGTQFLPTMTAAWVLARVLGPRFQV